MELNVDNIKQQWNELVQEITAYYDKLSTDEVIAFSDIALGFLIFLIGLILLL